MKEGTDKDSIHCFLASISNRQGQLLVSAVGFSWEGPEGKEENLKETQNDCIKDVSVEYDDDDGDVE